MSDPLEPYWAALGKFIHRYAQIEVTLNSVLRISSGISHKQATALFSGTRVTQAVSFIKRLHEAREDNLSPWLEKAFPKINELTTARDFILHQGFTAVGDKILVSNRARYLPRAVVERTYAVEDLINMEADACVAHACLNLFWLEERYPKSRFKMREREEGIARTPWRHTPPPPENNHRKCRKAAQTR